MNASRDGIQFSRPGEKSLARAKDIFKVMGVEANVKHVVFESGHDYSKPMRDDVRLDDSCTSRAKARASRSRTGHKIETGRSRLFSNRTIGPKVS